MLSRKFEASPALADYIKCYWYYHVKPSEVKYFDILPDGHFDLVITVKEKRITDALLTGIWTKAVSISYEEDIEVFGISFNPIAIGGLLPFNVKSLLDSSQPVSLDLFKIDEQIFTDYFGQPFFLIAYLNRQLFELKPLNGIDERMRKCFDLINESEGNISVHDISNEVGLSPRQLHKKITNMIGIGIKEYAKITRFKRSLVEVKKSHTNYHHYYDQSHFIREIKRYAGKTPKKMDLQNDDRFIQYFYFG